MTPLSWLLAFAAYASFVAVLLGAAPAYHPPAAPSTYCVFLGALSKSPDIKLRFERSFNASCPDAYRVSESLERVA